MGERHAQARIWGVQVLAAALGFALTVAGCTAPRSNVPATRESGASVEISKRGPGMHRQPLDALKLPVPRTFDLAHVDPTHFATALEKDPVRIFEFVRDHIAFEAYAGALRGPRGTLMAMAGNSIDRALLLGSLLEHAGHRIRYAQGMLSARDATDLVTSMWAERPTSQSPQPVGEPASAIKVASDTLLAGVKRDYALIRDQLKKINYTRNRESVPTLDDLVREALQHYWIQWMKEGTWTDLDSSFADATPGRTYTRVEKTFDALPEELFHRVMIRVRAEEYEEGKPSSREVLTYAANATDLSGIDLILGHQPENWPGPVSSLAGAIASALANTGRVKPVLMVGRQMVMGQSFRQKLKTGGIGGIESMLSGDRTIAGAETLEVDFIAPDGQRETAVREIYDLVGKTRRATGTILNSDEIQGLTTAASEVDLTQGIYSLFFTTGRIDSMHHLQVIENLRPSEEQMLDIDAVLRGVSSTFVAASDAMLAQPGGSNRTILFYPDSPRLTIAELSALRGKPPRIGLDLRRDHVRAVSIAADRENVVPARIFRGVVEGTLERVLMEYIIADASTRLWKPVMSTSLVFEQTQIERISLLLLPRENASLDQKVPEDALARLRDEVSRGSLAIVPRRAVSISGVPRLAWWRIDPQSGDTVAVTDEGLHQGVVLEYGYHQSEDTITVSVLRIFPNGRGFPVREVYQFSRFNPADWNAFLRLMSELARSMRPPPW